MKILNDALKYGETSGNSTLSSVWPSPQLQFIDTLVGKMDAGAYDHPTLYAEVNNLVHGYLAIEGFDTQGTLRTKLI